MESKLAHLDMIQAIVSRLANNSFLLKGWSISLISAFLAFAASGETPALVFAACFPAIIFWVLDAYFLHQERLFRKLYDHVRVIRPEEIDFSMNILPVLDQVPSWSRVSFSKTLVIFHGMILASVLLVGLLAISLS
ncbi:MAG: hypothetical protein F6K31_33885 [Symploca sp. SIO2G7]|nr:hypothetical protein [Symploca sp. SIO2G7]